MRTVTLEELSTPLSPFREVRASFLARLPLLDPERLSLDAAVGRVLAETVRASRPVPSFDSSAVDGYAIRGSDAALLGAHLTVGSVIAPGVAVQIMTGHPLPEGADTAIPWEIISRVDDTIEVHAPVRVGANVRPMGEDLAVDEIALEHGEVVTPLRVAVAASLGRTHLLVRRRPVVAVCSTGDEVTPPGAQLGPGRVFDANSAMLAAMISTQGGVIGDRVLLPDHASSIRGWLSEAAESSDLIVTSGGASVGVHDEVRSAVHALGSIDAWRLDVKPGKPVAVGSIAGTPVIVLPGNPAGAFVGGWLFAVGAVRVMQGASSEPRHRWMPLACAFEGDVARTVIQPVSFVGGQLVPMPPRSSVALGPLASADGFAVIPAGGCEAGASVEVWLPW